MRSYLLWNLQLNLTLAEKLIVNDKIKALCQTNVSPTHYIKR